MSIQKYTDCIFIHIQEQHIQPHTTDRPKRQRKASEISFLGIFSLVNDFNLSQCGEEYRHGTTALGEHGDFETGEPVAGRNGA